jgi:flagellar protein FliO/FliZ
MIETILLSPALRRVAVAVVAACLLLGAADAYAFKATPSHAPGGENTPLRMPASTSTHSSSGGASVTRTIVGFAIVLAVLWGLAWILRQVRSSRGAQASGAGLSSVATLPLGSGRSVHLVRAGNDYLLVGSAEHGVFPIHRYTEAQAREVGLLGGAPLAQHPIMSIDDEPPGQGLMQIPGQPTSSSLVARMRQRTVRW